jgi:hypothetical protein
MNYWPAPGGGGGSVSSSAMTIVEVDSSVTTTVNAVAGSAYLINSTAAAVAVNLPAGADGDILIVTVLTSTGDGGNSVTVDAPGAANLSYVESGPRVTAANVNLHTFASSGDSFPFIFNSGLGVWLMLRGAYAITF